MGPMPFGRRLLKVGHPDDGGAVRALRSCEIATAGLVCTQRPLRPAMAAGCPMARRFTTNATAPSRRRSIGWCSSTRRLRCEACGHDKLLEFSSQRRGFCPSCGSRRMSQTAAHLVEHVIPHVPVRQWVLSLPIPLPSPVTVSPLD